MTDDPHACFFLCVHDYSLCLGYIHGQREMLLLFSQIHQFTIDDLRASFLLLLVCLIKFSINCYANLSHARGFMRIDSITGCTAYATWWGP